MGVTWFDLFFTGLLCWYVKNDYKGQEWKQRDFLYIIVQSNFSLFIYWVQPKPLDITVFIKKKKPQDDS